MLNNLREILNDSKKNSPVIEAYYYAYNQVEPESEEETLEGVLDLLCAGHVTLSSACTNCCMFLAQYPEVADKLREEIEEQHFRTQGDSTSHKELDYTTINNMSYLNAVVKEVLRLCPPAGGGFRKALKSFELGVSFACQYTHTQCSVLNNANDPECS